VFKYVPIDLTLETEDIVETDQQIIVPEETDLGITEFLEEVKVPPGIAADAQNLLVNGFPLAGVANLTFKIFNEYQRKETEDTSACGASHAERRRAAKARSG
jgi:hypothetical protein